MDIMQGLQGIFGALAGGEKAPDAAMTANNAAANDTTGLSGILSPAALGGLAGALFSGGNKGPMRNALKYAAILGGGALLWDKLRGRVKDANAENPLYGAAPAPAEQQAVRIIRALVYAAKADGHIDGGEEAAINRQVDALKLGPRAKTIVQQALKEPLDPGAVANGVQDADEALRLFTLSCAVIDVDQFMERNYLDALGHALHIPDDVKLEIMNKIHAAPIRTGS